MREVLAAFASGTLFGAGLAIAQMTNPAKVLSFLDVTGGWDPSLAFVMGVALVISTIAYQIAYRRMGVTVSLSRTAIDARLIGGSTLFGLGWGLAGFCPGPAIASLVSGSHQVGIFVGAMILGMGLYRIVSDPRSPASIQASATE